MSFKRIVISIDVFYEHAFFAVWYLLFAILTIAITSGVWHVLATMFAFRSCHEVALAVFAHSQATRPHLWSYERINLHPPAWLRDLLVNRKLAVQTVTRDDDGGEL